MSIFDDDQKSMLDVYLYETNSLFEQLDTILMKTEKSNVFTSQDIHSIFRVMHTTKSSSSMMDLQGIATLMHAVEDLFSLFRDDPKKLQHHEKDTFDLLFSISDFMHGQLDSMKNDEYTPGNTAAYIMKTQSLLAKIDQEDTEQLVPLANDVVKKELENIDKTVFVRIYFEKEAKMENIRAYMLIMQIKNQCNNLEYYPAVLENNLQAAEFINNKGFYIMFEAADSQKVLKTLQRSLFLEKCEVIDKNEYNSATLIKKSQYSSKRPVKGFSSELSSIIPVDVSKLDQLQNLIGELMISESSMIAKMEEANQKELLEYFERLFHKTLLDIEEIIMSSRLVPVAQIVPKLNRVVRDISHKENKDINFIIKGEDIEIDKEIVDSLFNPLMHLLRNAVDHGIEPKEERVKLQKSKDGEIILNIENVNGEIVIHISDDGRGLDIEKIKEKAVSKGLIKKDRDYSREEILNLIMLPGFSTNQKTNEFSGRGVGLDVVKSMIDRFKGHISIDSEFQKGTHITLHLPLTLTIIESLLFKVGEFTFAIPSQNINQFFPYNKKNVQIENNHRIYLYNDKVLPIIDLKRLYHLNNEQKSCSQILIYIKSLTKEACIVVDDIIGHQHIVDKPLPLLLNNEFKKYTGILGCSLLGDGNISMTLNVETLLNIRGETNE